MEKSTNMAGSLKVSEEVVAKIARLAASEVEGVALDESGKKLARNDSGLLSKKVAKLTPTVKVRLLKEAAEIDIAVITLQGNKAAIVGEHVQNAVKTAVQSMTGIAVSKVNVKIAGIRLAENVS